MKYAKSHEWIKIEGNTATVGISDHAQEQLSDIVFVDLPDTGTEINKGDDFMSIESVKSASDIYAPVSGTITEVNEALNDEPELVNQSAEDQGWLIKMDINDESEASDLLDKDSYSAFIEEEG